MGRWNKVKVNIELENPDRCDGCPLLKIGDVGETSYCRLYGLAILKKLSPFSYHQRPDKCVRELGWSSSSQGRLGP